MWQVKSCALQCNHHHHGKWWLWEWQTHKIKKGKFQWKAECLAIKQVFLYLARLGTSYKFFRYHLENMLMPWYHTKKLFLLWLLLILHFLLLLLFYHACLLVPVMSTAGGDGGEQRESRTEYTLFVEKKWKHQEKRFALLQKKNIHESLQGIFANLFNPFSNFFSFWAFHRQIKCVHMYMCVCVWKNSQHHHQIIIS